MKTLLIGGPKNGTVLYVKGGVSVLTEHEGRQYEYRRQYFSWIGGGLDSVWPVFAHGEIPPDSNVVEMIIQAEIAPIGKASDFEG